LLLNSRLLGFFLLSFSISLIYEGLKIGI